MVPELSMLPLKTPPELLLMMPMLVLWSWPSLLAMVPELVIVPKLVMVPPGLLVMIPELTNIILELIVTESGELTIRDDTVHVLPPSHVPDIGADSHDD